MAFIENDLNFILSKLNQLTEESYPLWGSMTSQRMVEHLSDTLNLGMGNISVRLEIPQEKVERAQGFISSEHPMPKNFVASFADQDTLTRNSSLTAAISEFTEMWNRFHSYYEINPHIKHLHPNFGELDYGLWNDLNRKHITHHFEQFGLI